MTAHRRPPRYRLDQESSVRRHRRVVLKASAPRTADIGAGLVDIRKGDVAHGCEREIEDEIRRFMVGQREGPDWSGFSDSHAS